MVGSKAAMAHGICSESPLIQLSAALSVTAVEEGRNVAGLSGALAPVLAAF